MEFTKEEVELLEVNVSQVYAEGSLTINGGAKNGHGDVFSRTIKYGLSVDVPPDVGYEKTRDWARLQVKNYLNYQYLNRNNKTQGQFNE